MQSLGPSYWGVAHSCLSSRLAVFLPCSSLSSGLKLGWAASVSFVVVPYSLVPSDLGLMTSPLSAPIWFSALASELVLVLVLGSALGLGLVLVLALALI